MKTKLILLALGLILSQSPVWAGQQVNETRSADPDAHIEIEIISGSIKVNGWDRNEIVITGTIGNDVESLEVSGSGNHISIDLETPGSWGKGRKEIDVDLEISMPSGARFEAETVSAGIPVSGLTGTAQLASVSGPIDLSGSMTRAGIETVSGQIQVKGGGSRIDAESVSGPITLEGVSETVEVSTVSGPIDVSANSVDRADFESVAGSIRFRGSLNEGAHLSAEIHSGNVILELPGDTSASFEVETFSGSIDNDFGPAAERADRYTPGQWLKFSTGDGDSKISVESFSGSVELKKM